MVPMLDEAGTIQQLVMLPEAANVHLPWLRARLADYGADVRARLLAGLLLPATAYVSGLRARRRYCDELGGLSRALRPAGGAGDARDRAADRRGDGRAQRRNGPLPARVIPFNSPWSLAGLPAASVPCGFVDGLPVGLALVGRRFADATVLRAAHAFQRSTDWHERRPSLQAIA